MLDNYYIPEEVNLKNRIYWYVQSQNIIKVNAERENEFLSDSH